MWQQSLNGTKVRRRGEGLDFELHDVQGTGPGTKVGPTKKQKGKKKKLPVESLFIFPFSPKIIKITGE